MWVVNCFQIVSLTYWSQPSEGGRFYNMSCELLSNCIFDILVTTGVGLFPCLSTLWIAFKLYLWHIGHNTNELITELFAVVNCFQIVSLTYWSQRNIRIIPGKGCCELLSNCIFDILVTTKPTRWSSTDRLWIAFKLYLWHIGHNKHRDDLQMWLVVNCFQIVSLTYWSQLMRLLLRLPPGCELLSNCIFDILVTTSIDLKLTQILLWIAFKLYLWHIGHNK